MSDLLSNCCAADFDALGYEKEEGIWQERCLNCGNLCEPIMFSDKDIANIHRCVRWNTEIKDNKPYQFSDVTKMVNNKPEKIKMPDELRDLESGHTPEFMDWCKQITKAVNSLKERSK
jgi:hypothetical protein